MKRSSLRIKKSELSQKTLIGLDLGVNTLRHSLL
jgi:hypothetical protein